MFSAFTKAIEQLSEPATRRVLGISIATSIGVFIALLAVVFFLLTKTALFSIGWLDAAVDLLGGIAVLVLTWLLFPAVVSACVGLYLDRVADAVEARHYPHLPPPREMPLGEVIATTIKFFGVMVGMNLIVLVFLLFPPVFPFVFYSVNGYLLGREYFELVASRRMDVTEVRAQRWAHRWAVFAAGLLIALLLTVPLVNLIAPIIGTAAMVHLAEKWRRTSLA